MTNLLIISADICRHQIFLVPQSPLYLGCSFCLMLTSSAAPSSEVAASHRGGPGTMLPVLH